MEPRKEKPKSGKSDKSIIRSSAAEYLNFVAAGGQSETGVEMRYEDENIWLTREATVKKYLIFQADGNRKVRREMEHDTLSLEISRDDVEKVFFKGRH